MFAREVRFEGFTHDDWERVLELFRPVRPEAKPRDPDRPQGAVVAVHRGGKLLKLMHSRAGRLRLDDLAPAWPISSEDLARRHDASWALSIELGALDDAIASVGRRLQRDHDFLSQGLLMLDALQYQVDLGRIQHWPERLKGLPIPTAAMVTRALDMVCPPGKTLLVGLFEGDELWTSIALRRSAEGIDLVLGPDDLRADLGLLSGDFRRDYRHLAREVADRTGPLSLGCFTERNTFRQLEVDPRPGAWAFAVAVRDVILAPVPAAMALPLGLDAGRAALSALKMVAQRIDATGMLPSAFGAIRDIAVGDRAVEDVLGFHPLELLRKLLARDS
jgi:hypothetical protein